MPSERTSDYPLKSDMPPIVDKRTFVASTDSAWKGGMNKDADVRYIGNGYYIDARNISFMIEGSKFIVSNMKGNTLKAHTLNSGINVGLGGIDDTANNTVYAMIWNGGNNHQIIKYEYAVDTDTVTEIATGTGLGFEFGKLITGIDLVLGRFLVWGQEGQEIGCLDLDNLPASPIIASNRWQIELCKIPSPKAFTTYFFTDESSDENKLTGKLYQFRYRYVYQGGFRSPFSTISATAVPDLDYLHALNDSSVGSNGDVVNQTYYDNSIAIEIPEPDFSLVEKIEVFVRSEDDDTTKDNDLWFRFITLDTSKFNTDQDFFHLRFTGNEPLFPADPAEALSEVTFFPKSCKEIVFLPSNVLAILNFPDGLDTSAVVPKVEIWPEYNARPTSAGSSTTTLTYNNSNTADAGKTLYNPNFDIALSTTSYDTLTVTGTIVAGDVIQVDITLSYSGTVPSGITLANRTITATYIVKPEDTDLSAAQSRINVAKKLKGVIDGLDPRYDNFGGIATILDGNVIRLYQGTNDNNSPYTITTTVSSATTSSTAAYPYAVSWREHHTVKQFKRWSKPQLAIQYRDTKGRRSGAIPIGSTYIQGYDQTTNDGWVWLNVVIGHLAPSWAVAYDILLSRNNTYDRWLQLPVGGGYSGNNIVFTVPESIDTYRDDEHDTDAYEFNYVEGDRLRIIAEIENSSNDVQLYDEIKDFRISNSSTTLFEVHADQSQFNFTYSALDITYTNGPARMTLGSGSWSDMGFMVGHTIEITGGDFSGNDGTYTVTNVAGSTMEVTGVFSTTSNDTNATVQRNSFTPVAEADSSHIVEVWRPKEVEESIYYEVAFQGTIDGNRRHSGNISDQDASNGARLILRTGDSYSLLCEREDYPISIHNAVYEFQSVSCTYNARVTDIGRGNYDTPTDEDVTRETGVTWTQPIIANSTSNGLSVILGTSILNLDSMFGSVQKAVLWQNRELVVYFENKVGAIGIYQDLRKSANGNVSYNTDAFINPNSINYNTYDGGIGVHPESFAKYNNDHYFVSPKNNAVCRRGLNGIVQISNYGMTSWFNDALDVKENILNSLKLNGVFDIRNKSYILSFFIYLEDITLSNPTSGIIETIDITHSNLGALIDDYELSRAFFEVDLGGGETEWRTVDEITSLTEVSTNTVRAAWSPGDVTSTDILTGIIFFDSETLQFNEPANAWLSFLDFDPDYMISCGVDYISFFEERALKDGIVWLHNSNETRGSFYGTSYAALVEVPFNKNPSTVKLFENTSHEANDFWTSPTVGDVYTDTVLGNSSGVFQQSNLINADYENLLPDQYSAPILKNYYTFSGSGSDAALSSGDDMIGHTLVIKFSNSSASLAKLFAATVLSTESKLTL